MSKETYIGGDLVEEIGGSYKIYVQESYQLGSRKQIIFNGKDGISHNQPKTLSVNNEKKIKRKFI